MTPLERAKADLLRLQKDLGRAKATLVMLESQIARVEAYIEMAPVYESDESQGEATRARSNGIAATSVRLAIEAIKEQGKRIHTRDLLRILQDRGITIGGANPVANLSGFLSRSEELHNSRADGWGLAEWVEAEPTPVVAPTKPPELEPVAKRVPATPTRSSQAPSWEPAPGDDLDDEIPF